MINVLFVCMGNICRSPSAEAVMKKIVKDANLKDKILVDSAGTIAYHEGEPADARMKRHALRRGYRLDSIARKFRNQDFTKFDYIIAMDKENYSDLLRFDVDRKYSDKIYLVTDFARNKAYDEVPDPYYGGPEGFETVLDILEDSCSGLLEKIKNDNNL